MHAEKISLNGDGKREIRRRYLSPQATVTRLVNGEKEREREEDGEPSGELGEKLMKNIKIRRRKEARELCNIDAARGERRTAKRPNGEGERRGRASDR